MTVIINGKKYIRDIHTLKLILIGKAFKGDKADDKRERHNRK